MRSDAYVEPTTVWMLRCHRTGCAADPLHYDTQAEAERAAKVHDRHHRDVDARTFDALVRSAR